MSSTWDIMGFGAVNRGSIGGAVDFGVDVEDDV